MHVFLHLTKETAKWAQLFSAHKLPSLFPQVSTQRKNQQRTFWGMLCWVENEFEGEDFFYFYLWYLWILLSFHLNFFRDFHHKFFKWINKSTNQLLYKKMKIWLNHVISKVFLFFDKTILFVRFFYCLYYKNTYTLYGCNG